jgi:hypothetical protein
MSGYKHATVTISEHEYRRLHDADMKKRFKKHTKMKTENSAQLADLANTLRQMENRQRQLEEAFGELEQDSDDIDLEAIEQALAQNALCYESLVAIMEESASHANDSLVDLSQAFAERMQQERENYHRHLQGLVQRIDQHEQREQLKEQSARQWLKRSVGAADFIQTHYDHQRFLPGRLARIYQQLDFAQSNLAEGLAEASLQVSQQAFLELSELRLELEQRILEWQTEYTGTYSAIAHLLRELELNATVNAFGLQGEELPEQIDVAFWSDGKYNQLVAKCRQFLDLLTQDRSHISTEELQRIHGELPAVVTASFESILYEARLKALNSQLRMNIAEKALEALEQHGFQLSEAGYVDKDMRAPFMAQLANMDGSRVTVQVLPTDQTSRELSNELIVITNHPYLKTEHEARLQWAELCRTLNEYSLDVSRPEVREAPAALTEPFPAPNLLQRQTLRPKS